MSNSIGSGKKNSIDGDSEDFIEIDDRSNNISRSLLVSNIPNFQYDKFPSNFEQHLNTICSANRENDIEELASLIEILFCQQNEIIYRYLKIPSKEVDIFFEKKGMMSVRTLSDLPKKLILVEDSQMNRCGNCKSEFGLLARKHHCRECGNIFCGTCSQYEVSEDKVYHKMGENILNSTTRWVFSAFGSNAAVQHLSNPRRVCIDCYEEIFKWDVFRRNFHRLSLSTPTLKRAININEQFRSAAIYSLMRRLHIQEFSIFRKVSEEDKRFLWKNRKDFYGHSEWMIQLYHYFLQDQERIEIIKEELSLKSENPLYSCEILCCRSGCCTDISPEKIFILELPRRSISFIPDVDFDEYLPLAVMAEISSKKGLGSTSMMANPFIERSCMIKFKYFSRISWLFNYHKKDYLSNYLMTIRGLVDKYSHSYPLALLGSEEKEEQNQIFEVCSTDIIFDEKCADILKIHVLGVKVLNDLFQSDETLDEEKFRSKYLYIPFTSFTDLDRNGGNGGIYHMTGEYRVFPSATKPIILNCRYYPIENDGLFGSDAASAADINSRPPSLLSSNSIKPPMFRRLLFKRDDVMKDYIVQCIGKVLARILKPFLKIKSPLFYGILPVSSSAGIIEIVPNSITLAKLYGETDFGGSISRWLLHHNSKIESYEDNLAFYTILSYILGIGDRHLENIMITNAGEIFHIDYSYLFGSNPKPSFNYVFFTKDMLLAARDPKQLVSKCAEMFLAVRRELYLFYPLLTLIEPNEERLKSFLKERLFLDPIPESIAYENFSNRILQGVNMFLGNVFGAAAKYLSSQTPTFLPR